MPHKPPRRLAAALAVSISAHSLAGGAYLEHSRHPLRTLVSHWFDSRTRHQAEERVRKDKEALHTRIQAMRVQLVSGALEELKQGRLQLGYFIIRANHLDALEEGRPFDQREAERRYFNYQRNLYRAVKGGQAFLDALSAVVDLDYYGIPGGRMADALLEGGGSCVQISHLLAALAYDTGFKQGASLRVYGPNEDGIGHLAPTLVDGEKEYDLMAGTYAYPRGVRIPAASLIFSYAQAHGVGPVGSSALGFDRSATAFSGPSPVREGKPSGFVYPPATDSYPGTLPIFSTHAVKPFHAADAAASPGSSHTTSNGGVEIAGPVIISPYMKDLNPRSAAANLLSVENVQISWLGEEKKGSPADFSEAIEAIRLEIKQADTRFGTCILLTELVLQYQQLIEALLWRGKDDLAAVATGEMKKYQQQAIGLLGGMDLAGQADRGMLLFSNPLYLHDSLWHLIFLGREGEEAMFQLIQPLRSGVLDTDSHVEETNILAALLAAPATRTRAMSFFESLPRIKQLSVINVLRDQKADEYAPVLPDSYPLRALENMPPLPPTREGYPETIFPPSITYVWTKRIPALLAENHLAKEWGPACLLYFAHDILNPIPGPGKDTADFDLSTPAGRSQGLAFVRELDAWLRENPDPVPAAPHFRKYVDYVLSRGRFDEGIAGKAWELLRDESPKGQPEGAPR